MTLYFTNEEQSEFEASIKEKHFSSKFGFVNAHNGFRRGCMHLIVAGTGGGKSTLTRSLIRDIIFNKENDCTVALWLSEETVLEYKALFSMNATSHEKLLNTFTHSEQDDKECSELKFFEWMHFHSPDILIMDNITTSQFYMDKRPEAQAKFAIKLKESLKINKTAGIIIAHADSQQTHQKGGLLDVNNIRGSKTICNLTEFAYVIQTFTTAASRLTTIRVAKSRSQEVVHDLYFLNYDKITKSYLGDSPVEFKKFKEVFDARNKL